MTRVLPFVLLMLTATVTRADTLASAQIARALLGPDTWSRVLRLENTHATGRYPAKMHALVFELEGQLWFYTELDGTQSLSLYAGRLERDKADLGPLLREVAPNLARFEDLTPELTPRWPLSRAEDTELLPSGCFIKCIARWRALQSEFSPPEDVNLLAYYVTTLSGRLGHTVLVYQQDGRRYVYDPEGEGTVFLLPEWQPTDPLKLARAIYPLSYRQSPDQARMLALRSPVSHRGPALVAARSGTRSPAETGELPAARTLY